MTYAPKYCTDAFTDEEWTVLHEVSAAMRMTADEFLTSDVHGTSSEEARGYMRAFALHASDAQIRTMYYLSRALTQKPYK